MKPVVIPATRRPTTSAGYFAQSMAVISVILAVLVIGYQAVRYRDITLQHAREVHLRREFCDIPNVDKFHFVADDIEESRQIVEGGIVLSAFRRWWESTTLYTLFTLDSLYLKLVFFFLITLALILGMYMLYHYYSNK